jgi:polyhydroxybutyrate depolymerase
MAPDPTATRSRTRPRVGLLVPVVLVLVVVLGTSCASGGKPTASATALPRVAPSSGCGRRAAAGAVASGREVSRTLTDGALGGSYLLSVPRRYRPRQPTALILLFYGFDSDPPQFSALTELPARGSTDGYLVAVPHIQSGEDEWQLSGHGTDAAFVDAVVGSLERTYCVDRNAVFAAGFSAGVAFAIEYSCARENRIAAMATVAVEFQLGCRRPLSILAFHGTEDPLVPYQNGAVGLSLPGVKVRGTELNMGDWARLDRCRKEPIVRRIGTQVVRQQWTGCAAGAAVVLYTVLGGGHTWPGANPANGIGLTTQQVSATAQILSFFGAERRG